jgi:hypothetical protein
MLSVLLLLCCLPSDGQERREPTSAHPLIVVAHESKVQVFGTIYPQRFNAAQGEEAHYHLLTWQGGTSVNALVETPVDDLAFHDALVSLGAQPGDNLTGTNGTICTATLHEKRSPVVPLRYTFPGRVIPLVFPLCTPSRNEKPETRNQKRV